MKLNSVPDSVIVSPAKFADEVHDLADFVAAHPALLGPDVQWLAREPTLNGLRPDFLAWAQNSGTLLVVELKNQAAGDAVLLQTLKYADCLRQQPVLAQHYLQAAGVPARFHPERLDICVIAPGILPSLLALSRYVAPFQFRFIELHTAHDATGQSHLLASRIKAPSPRPSALPGARPTLATTTMLASLQPAIRLLTTRWLETLQPLAATAGLQRRDGHQIIRFQTAGGDTAFALLLRKTRPPRLALHLGEIFDAALATPALLRELRYSGKPAGVWHLSLGRPPHRLPPPVALLEAAISRVSR